MKEINVTINGANFKVKKTYRSLILFEEESAKPVSELKQSVTDLVLLFYCMLRANNSVLFSFDEFVDIVDNDNLLMEQFSDFLESEVIAKKK
jgi:hypothetical protein